MIIEPKKHTWTEEDTAEFARYETMCEHFCEDIFPERVAQIEAATIIDYYNSQRLAGEDPKRVLDRFHNRLDRLSMRAPRKETE